MRNSSDTSRQVNTDRAVFLIRIQFRQNASWQGEIEWLNGKDERRFFRSLLELIELIREALEEQGEEQRHQSWLQRPDDRERM